MGRGLTAFLLFSCMTVAPAGAADKKVQRNPDEIGKRDVARGVNFYSVEKEIGIGKEMAEEVERESRLLDDPVVSEYVNRLGQNLVRNSDAKVPFTIKVVDSEDVNAFALPGGFFFVNTGLILKADSEAELAGVMAHEIAHVAARHGTRQATRGQIANYASIPLIFMGGWAGYAVQQAAQIAIPMGFLRFSRGMESEADLLGLQYLYKSGYDPTAFVDFFERIEILEKKKPGFVVRAFSTHPMTGSRIKAAQEQIERDLRPRPEYVVDTSEFARVKARLQRIENRHKEAKQLYEPTLRRAPSADGSEEGEEDRPTLKRR
jgi:beta-barrel assembly-enhancing protease